MKLVCACCGKKRFLTCEAIYGLQVRRICRTCWESQFKPKIVDKFKGRRGIYG